MSNFTEHGEYLGYNGSNLEESNSEESNTKSYRSEHNWSNSNTEVEIAPQTPYKVNDPITYTNSGAKKTGKITEVLPIGNGTYGYMLADGTYLPHSRINGINLRSGQGGGARRKSRRVKRSRKQRRTHRR